MADPTQDPTAAGPGGAPAAGGAPSDPSSAGAQTITITAAGDGSYSVDDGDGDPPVPCKSIGDVLKAVHDALSGDDNDSKSQWDQEAAGRDSSGMPAQPGGAGGGAPQMSM